MTTEQRLAKLEKELEDIRQARDLQYVEAARRRIFTDIIQAGVKQSATATVNDSYATIIPAGGGSVSLNYAAPFTNQVRVTIDGTDYLIGLYTP